MKDFVPKNQQPAQVLPAWVGTPSGAMNHGCQIMTHIVKLMHHLGQVDVQDFKNLLDMNQNAGCGGDGSFSSEQWTAAKEILNGMQAIEERCEQFMRAPVYPLIRDNPALRTQHERKQMDGLFDGDDIPF